jgi:ribosomal protein S17
MPKWFKLPPKGEWLVGKVRHTVFCVPLLLPFPTHLLSSFSTLLLPSPPHSPNPPSSPTQPQVISDRTPKMATVAVPRLVFHNHYRFWRVVQTKCYAHDEQRVAGLGDVVRIRKATNRLSRLKR